MPPEKAAPYHQGRLIFNLAFFGHAAEEITLL